ncbi:MAG TPA: hypothetical protein VG713_21550, partial [Pirellulales bacterium]|nr:hypothetical protein [Pirellulales bacterium]
PKHQIKHQASRRQRRIAFERLWITYFGLRNEISLSYPRTRNRARFYWDVGLFYLRKVGGILLYDDHKWRRIKFLTASIADGFRGRFDNHKPKNILYGPSTLRD